MADHFRPRGTSVGVPCAKCGARKGSTVDSRPQDTYVRRRRECANCGHRFTTYETTTEPGDRGLSETQKKILRGVLGTLHTLVQQLAPK